MGPPAPNRRATQFRTACLKARAINRRLACRPRKACRTKCRKRKPTDRPTGQSARRSPPRRRLHRGSRLLMDTGTATRRRSGRQSSMEPVNRPSRHSAAPAPAASHAQGALERKLSLRCASPLPRVEAFTGAAPPACRVLPASSGALSLSRPSSQKVAPSPGSSVTAGSTSVSPSSSAASNASGAGAGSASAPVPQSPATAVSPSGLLRRRTASRDERTRQTSALTLPGAPPPAAAPAATDEARDFGVFEEDDFTDRFDSLHLNFDRDAALDEYLVFSRRYEGNVKMRAEVKEALPRKRVPGGALWERLYSDVSMQFGNSAREAARADVARRALSSGDIAFRAAKAQKSGAGAGVLPKQQAAGGRAEARMKAKSQHATTARPSPRGGRGARRNFAAAESSRTNRDDFLEFQGLYSRTARKVREAPRLLGGVKSFFRGLVGRRRSGNPEYARSYAQSCGY